MERRWVTGKWKGKVGVWVGRRGEGVNKERRESKGTGRRRVRDGSSKGREKKVRVSDGPRGEGAARVEGGGNPRTSGGGDVPPLPDVTHLPRGMEPTQDP